VQRCRAWTIGHSNREISEFLELLRSVKVTAVADVRRFPGSRRCPHFNSDNLEAALQKAGLSYRHFAELGGRRTSRLESSPNTAWRVEAFRAYADYMLTRDFQQAFAALITMASSAPTAVMCAEALPWRCHRRLIADQLTARGWLVLDIVGQGAVREHALPSFAKIQDLRVIYPGEAP
jgi:uncharacterized protein (DUF488 family)